jgi:hypothetical protein
MLPPRVRFAVGVSVGAPLEASCFTHKATSSKTSFWLDPFSQIFNNLGNLLSLEAFLQSSPPATLAAASVLGRIRLG